MSVGSFGTNYDMHDTAYKNQIVIRCLPRKKVIGHEMTGVGMNMPEP